MEAAPAKHGTQASQYQYSSPAIGAPQEFASGSFEFGGFFAQSHIPSQHQQSWWNQFKDRCCGRILNRSNRMPAFSKAARFREMYLSRGFQLGFINASVSSSFTKGRLGNLSRRPLRIANTPGSVLVVTEGVGGVRRPRARVDSWSPGSWLR